MSIEFGEKNPFLKLCDRVGYDHYDGILYDIFFNTRMLMEWHELQEKEQECTIPYTEKEVMWCRLSYAHICNLYEHEITGEEDMAYILECLREYFQLYDEWEGADEYLRFKEDRWHRTRFPEKIIINKAIW